MSVDVPHGEEEHLCRLIDMLPTHSRTLSTMNAQLSKAPKSWRDWQAWDLQAQLIATLVDVQVRRANKNSKRLPRPWDKNTFRSLRPPIARG